MSSEETIAQPGIGHWEVYDAAADGLTEYWHPAMVSAKLRAKPMHWRLLGKDLVFVRHAGRAYALEDRCPHRQIPLSAGRCEFPGTISCIYHGWTFDVTDGRMVAALTDGPSSPVLGRAQVRNYAVEERCGMVWVWMGEGEPVPLEEDLPEELLKPDARIVPLYRHAHGDWRHAAENGFDEAHGKMLHRSSYWVYFRRMAGWNRTEIIRSDDGVWLSRYQHSVHADDDYPGLGRWPRFNFWQRRQRNIAQGSNEHAVSIRLPAVLRVRQPAGAGWTHYEWYTPSERGRYHYLVFAVTWCRGWRRLTWRLRYWIYILWVHHYNFNNQDLSVVPFMGDSHPARMFRPDASITAWRRMVEEEARGPNPGRSQKPEAAE